MADPDRLRDRLSTSFVSELAKSADHPALQFGTENTHDVPVEKAVTIDHGDDWLVAVEQQLFTELWNGSATTVEQTGHVIDALDEARKTLNAAGFGDEALWLLHPKTKQRVLDDLMELVYNTDPSTLRGNPTHVSPHLPLGRAVLVGTAALTRNPQADIPSALSAWDDDRMAIDVVSPWQVRHEDGLVAVEFDTSDS
jgi:hypothetical protein